MVVWLTTPGEQGGAGMSHRQLSQFFSRSGGWSCHIAAGRWDAIRFEDEHARLLAVIYARERDRAALPGSVRAELEELHRLLGEALAKAESIGRKVALLKAKR